MADYRVINVTKGGVALAERVLWAGTGAERRRGLLGRPGLDPDEGIYIVPCEWVHTFGMKFAIDLAFLSAESRVLAIQRALKPYRLSKLIFRAEGVLELCAGRLEQTGTEVGDRLDFLDPSG